MLVSAAKWINLPLPFDEMCFKLFYMRFYAKTICFSIKATTTCNMKTKIISASYGKWHTNETGCMNYACIILWTHKERQTERERGRERWFRLLIALLMSWVFWLSACFVFSFPSKKNLLYVNFCPHKQWIHWAKFFVILWMNC